jgi:Arylsulfotransferase (ASST)
MTPQTVAEPLITRRRLLGAGVAAGGAAVLGVGAYGVSHLFGGQPEKFLASWRVTENLNGTVRRFHSAPELKPPTTFVFTQDTRPEPGTHLLMAPANIEGSQFGPMITDMAGEPIWFQPGSGRGTWATNFEVHSYRGAPVLVYWEGKVLTGYGFGEAVILDHNYREIARVRGANGHHIDLHELTLTDRGTALFTCPPIPTPYDMSAIGGPADGMVRQSIFQEVDIASGRLIQQWLSLGHVDPIESYRAPDQNFDYMHLNSIDVTPDGNLLISGRHTWALYKLDRQTGDVIWRLGGKRSQFELGPKAQFAWQHDVRLPDPQTLTVFDNGDDGRTKTHQTRGLVLSVDEQARRVNVARSYLRQRPIDATAMGSIRRLANGNFAVGWGSAPYVSEFEAGGTILADIRIGNSTNQKSYRSFHQAWSGQPQTSPALVVTRDPSSGQASAYVSWNGATEVAKWRVEAGRRRSDLRAVGVAPRRGFETGINLGTNEGYVSLVALDRDGRELGRSAVVAA